MYTAQGELVCDRKNTKEQFIAERPNMPSSQGNSAVIDTAINQNYCNINVTSDPKTGKISYSLRKECDNDNNLLNQ